MVKANSKTDRIFATPLPRVNDFCFDEKVADVFENMIHRSVPGYELILDMLGMFTAKYAQPATNCYDLGCSLGASTLKICQHLPSSCHLLGVDTSEAMIKRCRANMQCNHSKAKVTINCQSIQETPIQNASVVVINFTLQFIPGAERQSVLNKIAAGMVHGGVLILSEKVTFENEQEQNLLTELHDEFKKYRGYSDLEIAQKRSALENVLVPNSVNLHRDRLLTAGFSSAQVFIQCINFISLLAIK